MDGGISRRNFLSGLGAIGVTAAAANSMVSSLEAFVRPAESGEGADTPSWLREVRGTGAALLVAQLKAAGIEYVFCNPGDNTSIYDALVDEPDMHIITAPHESALAAMADGYAKASGKTAFITTSRPGSFNLLGMLWDSWKAQTPMVVATSASARDRLGQDPYEDSDHLEELFRPVTKWFWMGDTTENIPETTRRALKFASTRPCGPVFIRFPEDTLWGEGKALVMNQAKFSVPMTIRPDPALVEKSARLLLEARNPLLLLGDDIVRCGAEKEVMELAELLGLPVAWGSYQVNCFIPFPTRHPLYVGNYMSDMRYPGEIDVMLNLGSRAPAFSHSMITMRTLFPKRKVIEVRLDTTDLARTSPVEVGMVADTKLAVIDLLAAIRSMATEARLKQIREPRAEKTKAYTAKMRAYRDSIAHNVAYSTGHESPINNQRIAIELEEVLEKDTCVVVEISSVFEIRDLMSFGGTDKQYITQFAGPLGWGVSAALGVKLAKPDLPVVALVGDGAFMYSGPQPLWSLARYHAPVTTIVFNNRSYDAVRRAEFAIGGRMYQTGRDMGCYLGDPNVDHAKVASGFGVEAETVEKASAFRAALERAKRANVDGRPYLLDVQMQRDGLGAASMWHPSYSIAALRKRKV